MHSGKHHCAEISHLDPRPFVQYGELWSYAEKDCDGPCMDVSEMVISISVRLGAASLGNLKSLGDATV